MTLSTGNITQPLDLREIFINNFSGNESIFLGVAVIFFAILAAKFRMPNGIFGLLMFLFIILMYYLGIVTDWFILALIVVAVVIFIIITKLFKY